MLVLIKPPRTESNGHIITITQSSPYRCNDQKWAAQATKTGQAWTVTSSRRSGRRWAWPSKTRRRNTTRREEPQPLFVKETRAGMNMLWNALLHHRFSRHSLLSEFQTAVNTPLSQNLTQTPPPSPLIICLEG